VAPISDTLDTIGALARSVEDCEIMDAIFTKSRVPCADATANLERVTLSYAPRQHLADVDGQADGAFLNTLRMLKDSGAELVEVDLGGDFLALTDRTTWPIFSTRQCQQFGNSSLPTSCPFPSSRSTPA
jgi:indoleacetamide hydrolase